MKILEIRLTGSEEDVTQGFAEQMKLYGDQVVDYKYPDESRKKKYKGTWIAYIKVVRSIGDKP